MKKKYDFIIIGTGSGGLSVGLSMSKLGFKVLMIEKAEEKIGGDCLNFGCVPSKALIHISKIIHSSKVAGEFGITVNRTVDFEKVKNYIKGKQDNIRKRENVAHLKKEGIDIILGTATFAGKQEVEVNGTVFRGSKIIIATGSKPRVIELPSMDKIKYHTNESIFDIDTIPGKLLIIGAGPIGIELGQAFQRLGSAVTVIDRSNKILAKEDNWISETVKQQFELEGMQFILNASVNEFVSENSVLIQTPEAGSQEIAFDAVLMATGRTLNFKNLKLEKAGIKFTEKNIIVDQYLQTTNKNVFVAGDVAGGMQFSHAAEYHASILANNFFSPFKKSVSYDDFSWVTFTDPEIATFGLTESTLEKRKIKYKRLAINFKDDDRATVSDYQYGKMVLFIEHKSFVWQKQKILGGSMVAPGASEMIQELLLAKSAGLGINEVFNKIYPYPVGSRINRTIIQEHYLKQLSPIVKSLLRLVFYLK